MRLHSNRFDATFMNTGLVALILGLAGFLGLHLLRVLAPSWRQAQIARLGEKGWKGLYSLASIACFLLLLWGYAQARQGAAPLFLLPDGLARGLRHAVALLVLIGFWLLAAAYVPRNHLKAALKHPMTLSVKVWAFAHLLVNHTLPDLLLFGGFLLWAVLLFRSARRRPGTVPAGTVAGTAASLVLGTAAFAGFAFWLHLAWIGVHPLR
jgi:uncharacterized membrane protein